MFKDEMSNYSLESERKKQIRETLSGKGVGTGISYPSQMGSSKDKWVF
jgi:hypothetical protein